MMGEELFRKEVFAAKQSSSFGRLLECKPTSLNALVLFILTIVVVLIVGSYFVNINRVENAQGVITLDTGVLEEFSRQRSVVEKILINQGEHVEEGTPLFEMVNKQYDQNGNEYGELNLIEYDQQVALQNSKIANKQALHELFVKREREELEHLQALLELSLSQGEIWNEKVRLVTQRLKRYEKHKSSSLIEAVSIENERERYLDIKLQFNSQKESVEVLKQKISKKRTDLASVESAHKLEISEMQIGLSQLKQRINDDNRNRKTVYRAKKAGTITSILISEGQQVKEGQLLAKVLPSNSKLTAKILISSASIGLVEVGQNVNLKVDAYPFEKYGVLRATLDEVAQANSLTEESLETGRFRSAFVAKALLNEDKLTFEGRDYLVKPGMTVNVEVILGKEKVLFYFLRPILAIFKT